MDELAPDPASGTTNVPEAEVGVGLEVDGKVRGLRRDASGAAEFIDANGQAWDVKAFRSDVTGRGAFELGEAMKKIKSEIALGENIMLDTRHLSADHIDALRTAIAQEGLVDNVLLWP